MLDGLWHILASPYLTLLLLSGLIMLVLLTVALPQRPLTAQSPSSIGTLWLAALRERFGTAADLLLALGLVDIRNGRFLRLWLGLLVLHLIVACLDLIFPRHFRTNPDATTVICQSMDVEPTRLLEDTRSLLATAHYRWVCFEEQNLIHVSRATGGLLAIYIGALTCLAAAQLSARTGWWEEGVLLRSGQLLALGHGTELTVRATVRNSEVGAPTEQQNWQTELSFVRGNQEIGRRILRQDQTVFFNNLAFYETSSEPALLIRATDHDGRDLGLRTPETGNTEFRLVSLRFRAEDTTRYIVDPGLSAGGVTSRASPQRGNERYVLVPIRDITLRLIFEPAGGQSNLAGRFRIEAYRGAEPTPFFRQTVSTATTLEIENDRYTLEPQRYAVVKYGQDFGVVLFLIGMLVTIVGFFTTVWRPPERLWLVVGQDDGHATLSTGGVYGDCSKIVPWLSAALCAKHEGSHSIAPRSRAEGN